jgi:hypothetical protein
VVQGFAVSAGLRSVKLCFLFSLGLIPVRLRLVCRRLGRCQRLVPSPASGFRPDRRTVAAPRSAAPRAGASGWARCRLVTGPATGPTRGATPRCDGGRARPRPPGPGLVLDHLGAIPPLEQMAEAPPPPPGPDRIAGEEALHPAPRLGRGVLSRRWR